MRTGYYSVVRPPRKTFDPAALYDYAVRALGRRMRTVAELKRLLRQRVERGENGEAAVEAVISKLKEQRYLNDSHYAATYASYRQNREKFGQRRVIADLKAKGVHTEVIGQAVGAAYSGGQGRQLSEVAVFDRQIDNLSAGDHLAAGSSGGFQLRGVQRASHAKAGADPTIAASPGLRDPRKASPASIVTISTANTTATPRSDPPGPRDPRHSIAGNSAIDAAASASEHLPYVRMPTSIDTTATTEAISQSRIGVATTA